MRERGFSLIEMIMVIVITGIIVGVVAVFIRSPVEGYMDSVRRAELTDTAEVALRRLARDVRLALPNSLRVTTMGGVHYIEFIVTSSGGRYRDMADGSTGGDFLSFTDPGALSFDVLGPMPALASGDSIVVYNLGVPGADAYEGSNRAEVSSVASQTVTLKSNPYAQQSPPLPSPAARFQVVPAGEKAVTYACPAGTPGNLTRYWNYGFQVTQPTPPGGGNSALLATGATCVVEYGAGVTGGNGLLSIRLTLTDGAGESVSLFQQIHVDNAP